MKKTELDTVSIAEEQYFEEIEKLEKKEDDQIEEALMEILPEAFAVVKETARRLVNNRS